MGAALEKARVIAQIVGIITATSAVTRAASAVTTAAQAVTTAATVVATSSVIGTAMVGGVVIFKSASTVFDLLQTYFSKPPQYPPTAPHYEITDSPPPYCSLGPEPLTQDKLVLLARERLDMDVVKQYNFGVCGQSGTG
ncbi:unnamed protein product [Didymodactylos carnosus]|uniref:Uncharacterized protein n=1 Tax=Didymodactylos carnosus TaxID=1234261 RepID=A0A815S2T9_9BILA|nr:unnamed protein product [Didymodactylos carnosus]CAF1483557.1 unnamed protein product [Didymodactylos carnosus]CAF4060733.1 unnamed protein product [Didymodactylos carnosus]CAF4348096.1 unnamed protein product [Didymodactylos carnosus]